ncbi:MAG: hypothetical protein QF384_00935, partial [Alphaproteobacteria bacterium]|nr:hypothetical protein [Alphaproteobacteria bacterium]
MRIIGEIASILATLIVSQTFALSNCTGAVSIKPHEPGHEAGKIVTISGQFGSEPAWNMALLVLWGCQ